MSLSISHVQTASVPVPRAILAVIAHMSAFPEVYILLNFSCASHLIAYCTQPPMFPITLALRRSLTALLVAPYNRAIRLGMGSVRLFYLILFHALIAT